MKFVTHTRTPNNTGSPDYNICGQASSLLSLTNLGMVVGISKGNSTVTNIITTADLSTDNTGAFVPVNVIYGAYTINFLSYTYNTTTKSIVFNINVYDTGTTNQVQYEKFYLSLTFSKSGYQTFSQCFELYNYDVGNDATLSISGNTDMDVYLVNNTNNIVAGVQTKAFSSVALLQRPFTNEVHFYNMVGTQGTISYTNNADNTVLGSGQNGIVCSSAITVKETVTLSNANTCSSTNAVTAKVWLPTLTTTANCPNSCDGCVNDLATTTVYASLDYSKVSVLKLNNVSVFPTEKMTESLVFSLYDYTGTLQQTLESDQSYVYASYDPATPIVPVEFPFISNTLGANIVTVRNLYSDNVYIGIVNGVAAYVSTPILWCDTTITMDTCHWWTVTKGTDCGDYIFTNCSTVATTITLQVLNDDSGWDDVTTITVNPFTSTTINLTSDGVYLIKVPSPTQDSVFEYYTLPSYCAIQACWLAYLQGVICNVPKECDDTKAYYDFNAFMINAHTLFMMLNDEMNFNYTYDVISDDKLKDLFTMSSFIDRMTEYCEGATSNCTDCE